MNNFLVKYLWILTIILTWLKGSYSHEGIYKKLGSKVYYIGTEKINWFKANERCREMQGVLICLENDSEKETLLRYLASKYSKYSFWTGINSLAEQGIFYSAKTNAPIKHNSWLPESYSPECVALRKKEDIYYIEAFTCYHTFGFICESSSGMVPTDIEALGVSTDLIPSSKADQFIKIGPKYYFIETKQKVPWYKAYHICQSMNANLASLESEDDRKYLIDQWLKKFYTQPIWTGGLDFECNGVYRWEKSYNLVSKKFWLQRTTRKCVAVKIIKDNGKFYLGSEWGESPFICEARLPPQPNPLTSMFAVVPAKLDLRTESNYKRIGNKLYYISTDKVTWPAALRRCRLLNLHLFAWETESRWAEMNAFMKRTKDPNNYWSGLTNMSGNKKRIFIWQKTFNNNLYGGWNKFIDQRYGSCSFIANWGGSNYRIGTRNRNCFDKIQFICQE